MYKLKTNDNYQTERANEEITNQFLLISTYLSPSAPFPQSSRNKKNLFDDGETNIKLKLVM